MNAAAPCAPLQMLAQRVLSGRRSRDRQSKCGPASNPTSCQRLFPAPGKSIPREDIDVLCPLLQHKHGVNASTSPHTALPNFVMLFRSHHRPSNKLGNPTIRATVVPGHDSSTTGGGGGGGGCSNGAPSSTTGKLDQVFFFREAWGETGGRLAGLEALHELQSRAFLITQDREGKGAERLLQEQSWLERAPSNHCCSLHS